MPGTKKVNERSETTSAVKMAKVAVRADLLRKIGDRARENSRSTTKEVEALLKNALGGTGGDRPRDHWTTQPLGQFVDQLIAQAEIVAFMGEGDAPHDLIKLMAFELILGEVMRKLCPPNFSLADFQVKAARGLAGHVADDLQKTHGAGAKLFRNQTTVA